MEIAERYRVPGTSDSDGYTKFKFRKSAILLFQFLKYAGLFILAHIVPMKIAAIHGYIYACWQCLGKSKGAAG